MGNFFKNLFSTKWYSFKPISYIGMAVMFIGIGIGKIFNTADSIVRSLGLILFVVGLYLITKGRKEHGL